MLYFIAMVVMHVAYFTNVTPPQVFGNVPHKFAYSSAISSLVIQREAEIDYIIKVKRLREAYEQASDNLLGEETQLLTEIADIEDTGADRSCYDRLGNVLGNHKYQLARLIDEYDMAVKAYNEARQQGPPGRVK